ncbi:hypothetical protein, partial [Flavobacterium daejeonense]|uniref:hypothetical protein n=1 Tax=Flavobacterium daejeonense TaxID=350893 RepID=UPI00054CFA61
DQYCNCNEVPQQCYNTCPEGYYQTPDCGCASTIPPCSITSCPSGYTLQNCNCVQQQTQPPSNNTTSEIEKPLTQQEFNKLKTDNSDNYKIKEKTNQIITTSDGVTHLGTLTIFKDKNVANHFFYYFTPNAGDGQFIAGGFYRIPDSQGNSSYTSYISSSSGSSSTSPTPTWYNYDIDDFPSGQGYYIDQTTGIEHSITISQNNTPATVINDPVNVCQGCSDWYLDNDGDGYEGGTQKSTTSPGVGWEQGASMGVDCDDNNASIKECNLPTPVSVTNIATCKCIDPTKKANFSNVSFVYNVLEYKTWVSWQDYQDCAIAARKQNEKSSLAGTNPVGAGYQVNTFIDKKRQEESGKTTPEMNMQKAIDIVAKNLKLGKPVMAGVMYERYKGADKFDGGTDGDNNNVATNHFVTIVGMGIDNGKPYFSYYDNYVDPFNDDGSVRSLSARELIGTKTLENRFYYYKDSVGNYYFADKTATTIQGAAHGTGLEYVLTEIRDNQ